MDLLKIADVLLRNICDFAVVRLIGLEPTRRETPDPKSGASTNFATGAVCFAKVTSFLGRAKLLSGILLPHR